MDQKDYIIEALRTYNPETGQCACADCDAETKIAHSIINHENSTVKVVCNDCYMKKYHKWLYGSRFTY